MKLIVGCCMLSCLLFAGTINIRHGFRMVGAMGQLPGFHISSYSVPWLTVASDGSLLISTYDIDSYTPLFGALYRYYPDTRVLTKITDFNSTNGACPAGRMTESSNPEVLYGVTFAGGKNNQGTIYTVDLRTNEHKVVFEFEKQGLRHPNYGLIAISDHEFLGVCDSTTDMHTVAQEPYVGYAYSGTGYIFNSNTGKVSFFNPGAEYGDIRGLPVRLNTESLVILMENGKQHHILEYSISTQTVQTVVATDSLFRPISGLVVTNDSSIYAMNYVDEASSLEYPFLCYNPKSKQCTSVAVGSPYITMYSSSFTSDVNGNLYGYFKMGIHFGDGFMFKANPQADSVESFVQWPEDNDAISTKDSTQLTPGYDFISNPVITGKGYLYAISSVSGLVVVDLSTRKVEQLVRL